MKLFCYVFFLIKCYIPFISKLLFISEGVFSNPEWFTHYYYTLFVQKDIPVSDASTAARVIVQINHLRPAFISFTLFFFS